MHMTAERGCRGLQYARESKMELKGGELLEYYRNKKGRKELVAGRKEHCNSVNRRRLDFPGLNRDPLPQAEGRGTD